MITGLNKICKEAEQKKESTKVDDSSVDLAEKKAAVEKFVKASGIEDLWNSLSEAERNAIVGGGLGVAGGAGLSAVSDVNPILSMIAGGGLGGGAGYMYGQRGDELSDMTSAANILAEAGAGEKSRADALEAQGGELSHLYDILQSDTEEDKSMLSNLRNQIKSFQDPSYTELAGDIAGKAKEDISEAGEAVVGAGEEAGEAATEKFQEARQGAGGMIRRFGDWVGGN